MSETATSPTPPVQAERRTPWIAVAFLGALAIYAWGTAPSVLDHDSAELQTVAIAGGVAHSTGYPLFTQVGRLFVMALPGDPAGRVNLMSAVFGAASVSVLVAIGFELGLAAPFALAAAILFGAGFSFWASALRAEVYTPSVFVFLLAWWRTLVALRTDAPRERLVAAWFLGLSLTGQLSCVPAAAVLGLALAWRALRAGRTGKEWPALLGLVLLALTLYLTIPVLDARRVGLDFLRHVDWGFFPGTGVPAGNFDTPWKRLAWLVTGLNVRPGHTAFHPGVSVRTALDGLARVGLFETGPVLAVLIPAGLVRLWRRRRAEALRQCAMLAGSIALSAAVGWGPLFVIFLNYACAILAVLGAFGLEGAVMPFTRGLAPRVRAVVVPMLAALVLVPAHALRIRAYTHPIAPGGWSALDETGAEPLFLLWRFHDPRRYGDFGRAAVRALPESALVVSRWQEMTILYYERYALGRRPDLSLQQWTYPGTLIRARNWQATHDLVRQPIVFLHWPAEMARHAAAVDSVDVSRGYRLYFVRSPLHDLPAGKGDRMAVGG